MALQHRRIPAMRYAETVSILDTMPVMMVIQLMVTDAPELASSKMVGNALEEHRVLQMTALQFAEMVRTVAKLNVMMETLLMEMDAVVNARLSQDGYAQEARPHLPIIAMTNAEMDLSYSDPAVHTAMMETTLMEMVALHTALLRKAGPAVVETLLLTIPALQSVGTSLHLEVRLAMTVIPLTMMGKI
jgi:hypothetical protein